MMPRIILFYFCTLAAFVAVSPADVEDADLTIAGNYTLVTLPWNKKYQKYLSRTGVRDDIRKKIELTKPEDVHVWIKELNNNKYQVVRDIDGMILQMDFESGKEFDTQLLDGRLVKNMITVDQKAKTARVEIMLGRRDRLRQDVKFTKGGFNITMMYQDVVAVLEFSRDKI